MATAVGFGSQDIKPGGVGGGAATSASGGTIGSGGAAAVPAAVSATGADAHPAPAESGKASMPSNDGVPLIPLDLERRKISPKTKKLVLARLGVASKAEDDANLPTTTSDHTVSPSTVAEKSDLPAVSAPNPSEQQDPRTSPSAQTPSSDLEKKQRRAERFGLDLQISESEKRSIRAARFGATAGSTDQSIKPATPSSEAESEKRKARAARFGGSDAKDVKESPPVSTDVGKKAARAARFGLEVNTDAAEVEKRKARAARFGASPLAETDSSKKARLADVGFVASV